MSGDLTKLTLEQLYKLKPAKSGISIDTRLKEARNIRMHIELAKRKIYSQIPTINEFLSYETFIKWSKLTTETGMTFELFHHLINQIHDIPKLKTEADIKKIYNLPCDSKSLIIAIIQWMASYNTTRIMVEYLNFSNVKLRYDLLMKLQTKKKF